MGVKKKRIISVAAAIFANLCSFLRGTAQVLNSVCYKKIEQCLFFELINQSHIISNLFFMKKLNTYNTGSKLQFGIVL